MRRLDAGLESIRAFHSAVLELAKSMKPCWTYLLVSPLGMPRREWLAYRLAELGIAIHARWGIADWPPFSSTIYLRDASFAHLARAAQFEEAWRQHSPRHATGEAWAISPEDHERLAREKRLLRSELANIQLPFGALHALHLADSDEAQDAAKRVEAALQLMGSTLRS